MQKLNDLWQMLATCIRGMYRGALLVGTAALSNRGLAIFTLLGCIALATGPWLRPAISRDFRGVQIPWVDSAKPAFAPHFAAEVPRPWLLGSVATPILIALLVGIALIVVRRHRIALAFGILLAVSLPAVAASLWNHPALIETFESEVRQRAILREVFRAQSEDLLAGGAPDRLVTQGKRNTPAGFESTLHPVWLPFRYSLYGPWLVIVAGMGVLLASQGQLRHRLTRTAGWAVVGLLLAVAVTWPRWLAEYRWLQASGYENSNRLAEAEIAMDQVRSAMPSLEHTRRYWLSRGRLAYRQHKGDEYALFFVAHQHAMSGDFNEAKAVLLPTLGVMDQEIAPCELLAEANSYLAAEHIAAGDYTGAELLWAEAGNIAPWMPGHWIAQNTTALAANPSRADEMEQELLPRLKQVGDRMVNSDVASMIGDAYFNKGEFHKARAMYDRSIANFHLPKYANLHAQEGRLGM